MHRRQKFRRDLNSTGLMADSDVSAVSLLSQKNSRLAWHGNRRVAASYGVLPKNPMHGAPTKPKFNHRRGKFRGVFLCQGHASLAIPNWGEQPFKEWSYCGLYPELRLETLRDGREIIRGIRLKTPKKRKAK